MKQLYLFFIFSLSLCSNTFAWSWKDWWATRDQQGMRAMQQQDYQHAQKIFEDPDWQATAAYRAKDYKAASTTYSQLKTADGYYNQGNANAQLGEYRAALDAYQKSLTLRPNDQDTLHNKKIIEALLQQQKQSKQEQSSQKEDQDQEQSKQKEQSSQKKDQEQSKQEQSSQKKDQEQSKQEQSSQKEDQEQSKQEQSSQKEEQKQSKQEQSSQKESLEQSEKEESSQKEDLEPSEKDKSIQEKNTASSAENYQSSEQWLNMIPDDPGDLLRQKFLRDHQRRIHGENE